MEVSTQPFSSDFHDGISLHIENRRKAENFKMTINCLALDYDGTISSFNVSRSKSKVPEKTGAVLHNREQCVGCWMCVMVCPYGAIQRDLNGKKVASKCDLCMGKETPVCVTKCPNEALEYRED